MLNVVMGVFSRIIYGFTEFVRRNPLLCLLLLVLATELLFKHISKTAGKLLLPYLLPTVTVAMSWRMMLSPNYGIVNQVLSALNLPVYNWFSDVKTAFGMLVLIDVWQSAPFVFLLLYAALQSVPASQYEAARIDGANSFKTLFYVTIPNIKNSLALCALLRTIDSFRLFDKVNLLTGGGPANSTATITQYLYNYGIKSLDFGFGSAGAIVMTILVLILSSFYIKRALG